MEGSFWQAFNPFNPGKKATRVTTEQLLPVKAEREAGEKALWALVSLGWLWLQDRHQDRQQQQQKKMRGELEAEKKY